MARSRPAGGRLILDLAETLNAPNSTVLTGDPEDLRTLLSGRADVCILRT